MHQKRTFTLHTDESGEFEGATPRGVRLIAGLVLPKLSKKQLGALEARFVDIAGRRLRKPWLDALHAGSSRTNYDERAVICRDMADAINATISGKEKLRLIVLIHERDRRLSAEEDPFTSAAFAANRYQTLLLELIRQVLCTMPGLGRGDAVDLHLASRVFPVKAKDVAELTPLGYTSFTGNRGDTLVRIGDVATIRAALQALLLSADAPARAQAKALTIKSIQRSGDPRFHAADFFANLFLHAVRDLDGADWETRQPLGKRAEVTVVRTGNGLAAITRAFEAVRRGDPAAALEALTGVEQPAVHGPLVDDLLVELLPLARKRVAKDPLLADRLLDTAERLLDFRVYRRLSDVKRAAAVVSGNEGVAPDLRARARRALGTVANHSGDVDAAVEHLDAAVTLLEQGGSTLHNLLDRTDVENRRAVAELNRFCFDQVTSRLQPWLELLDLLVRDALGNDGRERIAGEIAGTMAQAACHRGDWRAADETFAVATRHLGEDHMQAAFRAHAAIDRDDGRSALAAAAEALGSRYEVRGYDRDLGWKRLKAPLETFDAMIETAPFNAWLLLKLAERGWLDSGPELAEQAWTALQKIDQPLHPYHVIHLAAGRLAHKTASVELAIALWKRSWTELSVPTEQVTLRAIQLQNAAHLGLVDAPRSKRAKPWNVTLARQLETLCKRSQGLKAYFGDSLEALDKSGRDEKRSRKALRGFLGKFTYLYH